MLEWYGIICVGLVGFAIGCDVTNSSNRSIALYQVKRYNRLLTQYKTAFKVIKKPMLIEAYYRPEFNYGANTGNESEGTNYVKNISQM